MNPARNAGAVRVLEAFGPFFRLLQVYNPANFRQNDRRQTVRSICCASGVFACTAAMASSIPLAIWYLAEQSGDLREVFASGPLILSASAMLITGPMLTAMNREIGETIGRLQDVVDHRKSKMSRNAVIDES